MGAEQVAASIKVLTKERLTLIELFGHTDVLRSLPRKHEHHLRLFRYLIPVFDTFMAALRHLHDIGNITADKHSSMCESSTANLQRVGHVGEVEFGIVPQMANEPRGRSVERLARFRGDSQQLPRPQRI